jgi:hypothetical protein
MLPETGLDTRLPHSEVTILSSGRAGIPAKASCPAFTKPFAACWFNRPTSQNAANILLYCAGDFASCHIYRRYRHARDEGGGKLPTSSADAGCHHDPRGERMTYLDQKEAMHEEPLETWRFSLSITPQSCLYRIIDKIDVWSPDVSIVKPSLVKRVVFVAEQCRRNRLYALLVMGQQNLAALIGATDLSFHPDHPDRALLEYFRSRLDVHGIATRELWSSAEGIYDRICEESFIRAQDLHECLDRDHLRYFDEWNNGY